MSASGQGTHHQQRLQVLQNELATSNQLLRLISIELQVIKQLSRPSGALDTNVKKNEALIKSLASLRKISLENLPTLNRKYIDMSYHTNQNNSYENHDSFRNTSDIDESQ